MESLGGDLPDYVPCPVDNFYWMTRNGLRVVLTSHANEIFVDVGRPGPKPGHGGGRWKTQKVESVGEGLRLIADKLDRLARNKK